MAHLSPGLHQVKRFIYINAPVEVCYQAWTDSTWLVHSVRRLFRFQYKNKALMPINSTEDTFPKTMVADQDLIPSTQVKQWLVSGPGGKFYEAESMVVLDIPNHFFCTVSTDPDDLAMQSSLSFYPDGMNQNTFLEWRVSLWFLDEPKGKITQLISDIWEAGDPYMEDCLHDFKAAVENRAHTVLSKETSRSLA